MVHWWELWSPGLQAAGGMAELTGALFLALEWRRSVRFADRAALLHAKYLESLAPHIEDKQTKDALKFASFFVQGGKQSTGSPLSGNELILAATQLALGDMARHKGKIDYLIGFVLIISGMIMQIAANGIAWAGSYGLLG